jgi:DNA end-binding protein Ku
MRSIWKGHIRFLLVAIPIRIYKAIEASEKIRFNQLHREDYGTIAYDKRCNKCNQIVNSDQITKGYQFETDRYAIVEPEDISKIKIKTTKAVDIVGFVNAGDIPTTVYDSPYFAGPDGAVAEKPYSLLHEVMKQSGKIGIGKVVLRDREDLVAIFPQEDGLVLQTLRYPHEVRNIKDVPALHNETKLDKKELALATTLVEQMTTTLEEIDMSDQYHEALKKLIDSKVQGKKTVEFEPVEELPRLDIMSALKKSLQASSRKPMVKATPAAAKKKPTITLVKSKPIKKRKAS